MTHILLTGCSGYIGSKLVAPLVESGARVTGIDRRMHNGTGMHRFVHADLFDAKALKEAFEGIDAVWHLAAAKDDWGVTDEEYHRDNFHATEHLVEAGRKQGVKRWVFFSTVAVMGPSEFPLDESAPFAPAIPYGASKADAERLFHEWAAEDPELEVMIIRPSVVFGADNPASTNVYRLIEAIHKNRFLMIGNGEAYKSTSYIENLLAATFFLADRMEKGVQTYIYVDEPVVTTDTLVEHIYSLLGKKRPRTYLPLWLARPVAYIADLVGHTLKIDFPITAARIEKFCTGTNFSGSAIRSIGFEQPVSNGTALARTVAWHLSPRAGQNGRQSTPKRAFRDERVLVADTA